MAEAGHTELCTLGVDVAAEHLVTEDGRYRFGDREFTSPEFADHLSRLARRFRLTFLEDPFDPADDVGWARLRGSLPRSTSVVGDDLFATDATRIGPGRADGILLKLSQAGTVTATLAAARRPVGRGCCSPSPTAPGRPRTPRCATWPSPSRRS